MLKAGGGVVGVLVAVIGTERKRVGDEGPTSRNQHRVALNSELPCTHSFHLCDVDDCGSVHH
jgi:hypothetical protein